MKKTYNFLRKSLLFVIIGAIATSAVGVVALALGYNNTTSWLQLKGACTIIFAIFGLATVGFTAFVSIKAENIHIEKIRKSSGFVKLTSFLAFAIIFFIFGFELVKTILASYKESFSSYFSIWRIMKFIFALPCSLHFLFMALPSKYKRKKIVIPKPLLYITSSSTVIWAIFGLLATYFYTQLTTMNILKIWHLLTFLVFIVFFLFEVKFEHIKPNPKAYIFVSLMAFIASMAFSLTTIIGLICGIIPASKSFSAVELTSAFVVGLYALSRVCALIGTMKYVLVTRDNSSHSSKFDSHHHHHHSSHSDNK